MATPTNQFDSYDAVGIREDLSDMITQISPTETPFYSGCKSTKATNTYHEWQTDELRAAVDDNAHIEGDATTATARQSTTRLGSYTQIFKNAVNIPDTDEGLNKAGRAKEMSYQIAKMAAEVKRDVEMSLFANKARNAGASGSTARVLAGLPSWIVTNIDEAGDATAATGDGTDARTDGTQAAFSQTRFDGVMQSIWTEGGNPDTVYLSAYQMDVALGFTGMNNQRSTIGASVGGTNAVINAVDVYVTPYGTVSFKPSRLNRSRDVFILQSDMFEIANLRGFKTKELAKTGDSTTRQIVGELTLVSKNEKASGAVFDCSTS